jgi:hypothetical protein
VIEIAAAPLSTLHLILCNVAGDHYAICSRRYPAGGPNMKKTLWFTVIAACLVYSCPSYAEAPRKIAGFVLGNDISQFKDLVRMDSALPIRHMEYVTEVETKKIEGYKNGYVFFGTCAQPGRILKVKLKYEIPDRWFFDELLDRFKKKFGQPSEWKGDPFQSLIAWKWSIKDTQKNTISMILQHYSGDDEEFTAGNSLRITMRGLIDQERQCFEKKHPEEAGDIEAPAIKLSPEEKNRIDFGRFIPE